MMADCIFCDIVAKKAPAEIVHEDEQAVAFRDINGLAPVHLLVVPRTHVESIDALEDDELLKQLLVVARKLGQEHSPQEHGYRIAVNAGNQIEVPHLHVHVIGGKPALGEMA